VWGTALFNVEVSLPGITVGRYTFPGAHILAAVLAAVIAALLRSLPFMLLNFGREWTDHQNAMTNPGRFSEQRRMLRRKTCRGSVAKSA